MTVGSANESHLVFVELPLEPGLRIAKGAQISRVRDLITVWSSSTMGEQTSHILDSGQRRVCLALPG